MQCFPQRTLFAKSLVSWRDQWHCFHSLNIWIVWHLVLTHWNFYLKLTFQPLPKYPTPPLILKRSSARLGLLFPARRDVRLMTQWAEIQTTVDDREEGRTGITVYSRVIESVYSRVIESVYSRVTESVYSRVIDSSLFSCYRVSLFSCYWLQFILVL